MRSILMSSLVDRAADSLWNTAAMVYRKSLTPQQYMNIVQYRWNADNARTIKDMHYVCLADSDTSSVERLG